ncbi:MAG: hypothetical protein GF317_00725 [Candidatus Lokiarchaeota archaeon]|nr:hypothetical protein [Candidatus Lokiarchaeota archaeon]
MDGFNDEQIGDFKIDYNISDIEIRGFIKKVNQYPFVRRTTSSCTGHRTKDKVEMI